MDLRRSWAGPPAELLTGSVFKRTTDFDPVPVLGSAHGALILVLVIALVLYRRRLGWSPVFWLAAATVLSPGAHWNRRRRASESPSPAHLTPDARRRTPKARRRTPKDGFASVAERFGVAALLNHPEPVQRDGGVCRTAGPSAPGWAE